MSNERPRDRILLGRLLDTDATCLLSAPCSVGGKTRWVGSDHSTVAIDGRAMWLQGLSPPHCAWRGTSHSTSSLSGAQPSGRCRPEPSVAARWRGAGVKVRPGQASLEARRWRSRVTACRAARSSQSLPGAWCQDALLDSDPHAQPLLLEAGHKGLEQGQLQGPCGVCEMHCASRMF